MRTLILFIVPFFLFSTSCTTHRYSLVPDESKFSLLPSEQSDEVQKKIKIDEGRTQGTSVHSVEFRTTLKTTSFEHAMIFTDEFTRISLYTPNFSKLLFYAVSGPVSSISSDMGRREAVIEYVPDKIYLPELPSSLLSMENYKAIIFGYLPAAIWSAREEPVMLRSISNGSEPPYEYMIKGRSTGGKYEALLKDVLTDIPGIRLERTLFRPDDSKDVLEITYEYSDEFKNIPQKITLEIKKQSIRIHYTLKKFNPELTGDFQTLFSFRPPDGFKVYVVEEDHSSREE